MRANQRANRNLLGEIYGQISNLLKFLTVWDQWKFASICPKFALAVLHGSVPFDAVSDVVEPPHCEDCTRAHIRRRICSR